MIGKIFRAKTAFSAIVSTVFLAGTATAPAAPTAAEVLRITWVNPPTNPPHGVRHATFPSKAVGAEVGYNVYLPDAYDKEPDRRFPVVYYLHGSGGNESRNVGLAEFVRRATDAGQIEPMLVVFVNGGSETGYHDSVDGTIKAETMIIDELIPCIDATYRTVADRAGRAIQGFSMGGGGALRLAIKYPTRFSSVVVYGAGGMQPMETIPTADDIRSPGNRRRKIRTRIAMMGDDLDHWRRNNSYYLIEQNAEKIRGIVGIRLVIGSEDFSLEGSRLARKRLDELKIPHEYQLVDGVKHNIRDLYRETGHDGLRFHQKWFGHDAGEK